MANRRLLRPGKSRTISQVPMVVARVLSLLLLATSVREVDGWTGASPLLRKSFSLRDDSRTAFRTSMWLSDSQHEEQKEDTTFSAEDRKAYDLGLGKNAPIQGDDDVSVSLSSSEEMPVNNSTDRDEASVHWIAPVPARETLPPQEGTLSTATIKLSSPMNDTTMEATAMPRSDTWVRTKKLISRNEETKHLRGAVWDEAHYGSNVQDSRESAALEQSDENDNGDLDVAAHPQDLVSSPLDAASATTSSTEGPPKPVLVYPDIDLSIPPSVYSNTTDAVWDLLRYEAYREAQQEPLLVSFIHSTILNHRTLESALAFHLANCLSSPSMISTQIQSLVLDALENSPDFRQSLRADMMAVRDRDPACTCLPDVFLYFKGFHALQTHRVAHYMYRTSRQEVLAHYLQSQVSQNFQIDIHPNATLGAGIMLDHGTGIVIGETAMVGHNCSILHHCTLGGSGKKGVDRHPKVGKGVLLGAGASVLGNVKIGDGSQIGAGTLVIADIPPHSVAVGVPAKIIGRFVDVTEQPSIGMNQMTGTRDFDEHIQVSFENSGEYI